MTEKQLDELILQLKIQNQLLSRLVLVSMLTNSTTHSEKQLLKEVVQLLNGKLDIDDEEIIEWANSNGN